ncbi:MAG: Rrf2 family transcriptional regulator [Planctomycetota bacterium]
MFYPKAYLRNTTYRWNTCLRYCGFNLAQPAKKITMLQIIEAVEGPMISQLNLKEQARGEKFAARAEKNYEKAIAQAKSVFEKAKLTDLLAG